MSKALNSELLKKLEREMLARKILSELVNYLDLKESVKVITDFFHEVTDCEFVGIGIFVDKKPFYYYQGEMFGWTPSLYLEGLRLKEIKIAEDEVWRTECLSRDVLDGNVDKNIPFCTYRGSFWTNDLPAILDRSSRAGPYSDYRTLALIRILGTENCLGLIQLFSKYTPLNLEMVLLLENLGYYIGTALRNIILFTKMKKTYEELNKQLISICSVCKKINEENNWEHIEDYLNRHLGAEFSHDICPECLKRLYPTVFAK